MAGAGGGALRLTYEGSASHIQQHNQRLSITSRGTMEYKLDGPSSTLHMATDIQSQQLAVASRTIFKIFNIRDEGELINSGKLKDRVISRVICFLLYS